MNLTYRKATAQDIDRIFELSKKLIEDYEQPGSIDLPRVLQWVRCKIENAIEEYTVVYANGQKAGYYHFFRNEDGQLELDDLYIFPSFQNRGIGTAIIQKCLASVNERVILYVFIKNTRAISLYRKLGFEVAKTVHSSRYIMHSHFHHREE